VGPVNAGPNAGPLLTLSDVTTWGFSNWLVTQAAQHEIVENNAPPNIGTYDVFVGGLIAIVAVGRIFCNCDIMSISLACCAVVWVFFTRLSTVQFAVCAHLFFSLMQLSYCEPIHSFISLDGLSASERFYGVASTKEFQTMSGYVASSLLWVMLSLSNLLLSTNNEDSNKKLMTVLTMQNVMRIFIILWDTNDSKLMFPQALSGLLVTLMLLYLSHLIMVRERIFLSNLPDFIALRFKVRWAAILEAIAVLLLYSTFNESAKSVRGSTKWYFYHVMCIVVTPKAKHESSFKGMFARFAMGGVRAYTTPLAPGTWLGVFHATTVVAQYLTCDFINIFSKCSLRRRN
jgi:hypothetical protein